eukprot:403345130
MIIDSYTDLVNTLNLIKIIEDLPQLLIEKIDLKISNGSEYLDIVDKYVQLIDQIIMCTSRDIVKLHFNCDDVFSCLNQSWPVMFPRFIQEIRIDILIVQQNLSNVLQFNQDLKILKLTSLKIEQDQITDFVQYLSGLNLHKLEIQHLSIIKSKDSDIYAQKDKYNLLIRELSKIKCKKLYLKELHLYDEETINEMIQLLKGHEGLSNKYLKVVIEDMHKNIEKFQLFLDTYSKFYSLKLKQMQVNQAIR